MVDPITTITNEHLSLNDSTDILESKLTKFRDKASYNSVLDQNPVNRIPAIPQTPPVPRAEQQPQGILPNHFVIEVWNPVPEDLNALPVPL